MRPRRVRCRALDHRVPNENRITDSEIFAADFRLRVEGDADCNVCIFCIGIGSPTVQDVARRANCLRGFCIARAQWTRQRRTEDPQGRDPLSSST